MEERPSKHLWLGNLNARLPRTSLKAYFEAFGPVDDVVTFPGRMYAFVNFRNPEDARAARVRLDDQQARGPSRPLVQSPCRVKLGNGHVPYADQSKLGDGLYGVVA